eukprot:UN4793
MLNKWVALPGPEHEYFSRVKVKAGMGDRAVRATNLCGPSHDLVKVEIVNEDALSMTTLNGFDLTFCPHCGEAIERESGCPQMHCTHCGRDFTFQREYVTADKLWVR